MIEDDTLDALMLEDPDSLRRAELVRGAYAEISDLGLPHEEMCALIAETFADVWTPEEIEGALKP